MIKLLITLCGSLLYRIRGGLLDIPANKIYFPIFIGIVYFINFGSIPSLINGFMGAYLAQQIFGWGTYRGALIFGSKVSKEDKEVEIIEDILNSLKITIDGRCYKIIDYPRTWGFLGCSLRGLISSFLIGSCTTDIALKYCGILVGFCYLIPVIILWKTKYHNTKMAWNLGEYLEGALYTYFILRASSTWVNIF